MLTYVATEELPLMGFSGISLHPSRRHRFLNGKIPEGMLFFPAAAAPALLWSLSAPLAFVQRGSCCRLPCCSLE